MTEHLASSSVYPTLLTKGTVDLARANEQCNPLGSPVIHRWSSSAVIRMHMPSTSLQDVPLRGALFERGSTHDTSGPRRVGTRPMLGGMVYSVPPDNMIKYIYQ